MENTQENAQKFVEQLMLQDKITEDDVASLLVKYSEQTYGVECRDLRFQLTTVKAKLAQLRLEASNIKMHFVDVRDDIKSIAKIPSYKIFTIKKAINDLKSKATHL